ncbi:MAG: GSCFA domain-containing protein [Bacteroidales bacterium]|nr:GSCFA domain-containing protein [Bacteroidales bacterium]
MNLITTVEPPKIPITLSPGTDSIVMVGSCFATEMAAKLVAAGFEVELNPTGIMYNPMSIANCLDMCIDGRFVAGSEPVEIGGLWHSWHFHGSFSRPTADECLQACAEGIRRGHEALSKASCLMVTLGTSWVYELDGGMVVGNCHKAPAARFARRRLTVDEILVRWQPLLQKLSTFNPQLSIVFTVSPIRHLADGAHQNQLSKATLLLAVDVLLGAAANGRGLPMYYFPAYELLLDELRDYRFYADDLTHPSNLAVEVVWERFADTFFTPQTRNLCHLNAKQAKRDRHIPLH